MKEPSPERGRRRGSRRGDGGGGEREAPDRQQAWDYLLNVLSRQAYTVAELRKKLARRRVPEELGEELLARLGELGLVDDRSFAEQYVSARREVRGRLALRAELRRKGVAEDIVEARVLGLGDGQQLSAAVGLLRKHAWRYQPAQGEEDASATDEYEARNELRRAEAKARSFLARRGFSPDVVAAAVEQVGWFEVE